MNRREQERMAPGEPRARENKKAAMALPMAAFQIRIALRALLRRKQIVKS